jgi:protein TonB
MRESLGLLGAAKSIELAEVTGYLKRAAEYARVVRESVWSELPEASWQTRKELDALVAQVQDVVEARALEQLRARLLALATELEQGTIVHRRAHRLNELNKLREQAINELRSKAGPQVAPPTLPGPEAERWVAWAEALREPEDVEALKALRDGFPHLDDFIANLEPNLWVAAKPPAVEVPPKPEKPAEKIPPSRMAITRVDEPAALAEPLLAETEVPSETRQEEAGFTELLDRLRRKRSRASAPAEEEPQPISEEEPAPLAAVAQPAREPVERTAPPVEPPPPSAEVPTEASAAPGIALRVKTGAEELWSGDWRKSLATPAVLVCVALLLVLVLGAAVWRLRRNHAGVSTVQATEKVPDQAPGNPQNNVPAQAGMPVDAALSAAQASTPKTEIQQQPAAATPPSIPKTEAAKPSKQDQNAKPKDQGKPQDQNSFAKMLASIKQGNNKTALNPPAAAQSNTATAKKEEAAPPAVAPNGAGNIVQNIPVAVSTTTDRPPGAAAPQPTTTAALQPPASAPQPAATAPPPASAGPQKVSSGVAQGLLVRQVAPQYPQAARQAHISGTVVLQVVIGKDGSVQNLHALSGPPLLIPSAMEAVKQWRYKPYQLNGEPVEANTQINVKFSLPNE